MDDRIVDTFESGKKKQVPRRELRVGMATIDRASVVI
jgi:hypothetical protein